MKWQAIAAAALLAAIATGALSAFLDVEVLKPISALPAHALAKMPGALSVARLPGGDYLVLDRREHTVFRVDPNGSSVRRLMDIGAEGGKLLRPSSMFLASNGIVAVLDAPTTYQRIQYFDTDGKLIGIFYLPLVGTPNVVIGEQVFSGVGALSFNGRTFLVNEPAWGSLFAELDNSGKVLRHVGEFRRTGYEADKTLHLAFNTGLPIADPTGGAFFVFQTGVPVFRKYDRDGKLIFERHIEGVELDGVIQTLPNRWLERGDGSKPFPIPVVHTAAADPMGRLWIAVRTGYTYVYDARGEKIRTIRFDGARQILPTSFHFPGPDRLVVGPEGYEFDIAR
jgi:hypothetical protein